VPGSPKDVNATKPVLVICRSGRRSLTAAAQLRDEGFEAVSVNGGMVAWQQAGGLVVRTGGDLGTII
jgi:rhodanese-related sulfurtransferase